MERGSPGREILERSEMSHLRVASLFSVAEKTVLVTGGGKGIGRMLAAGFVENGNRVYIAARDKATLDNTAAELNNSAKNTGGQCIALQASLGTREGCEALAAEISEQEPNGLNILVNNSGTSWGEPLSRTSGRMNWGWDKVLDLNVKAPFYLTRAMLPSLQKAAVSEDPARVIMIGSVVGKQHQMVPTHAYDASKAALHSLTRKLAYELACDVTVNCIAPGYVPTKMTEGLSTWGVDGTSMSEAVPLRRMGNGSDLAGAALYLSSRAGSWITGAILPVDGGILCQPISLSDESMD